jgi:hypothetical protein
MKALLWFMLVSTLSTGALARNNGQWTNSDPVIRKWYQELMQPDNPTGSCCGEADSYWADEMRSHDGKNYAVINDDRDDIKLGRPHIENGTEIEIPDHKLKWDRSNPTGHAVIFLSAIGYVFCFVQNGGA